MSVPALPCTDCLGEGKGAVDRLFFRRPDGRLMQIVRQERMIELYMETHNFWDLRRWKLGEKYFGVYPRGLNVEATKDEDFFKDTQMTSHIREFRTPANYLMPIPVDQVSNNPQMVQNPGY